MSSIEIPTVALTEIQSWTGVPPLPRSAMRARKGLNRTAFYPTIGRLAKEYKLHNSYLKPDRITDPLDEYWACRKVAGLWDVTGEEVIEVTGPDALAVLDELSPRDLRRMKDGECRYAVMCYDYGGIVEDAVLVRFSAERLWWVGGPGFSEQAIYARAIGRKAKVVSYNDEIHVASLQGPQARDLLQNVTEADLSRVPFYGVVETKVCGAPATITRTGYTAELGYDIYVDVVRGTQMFADLWDHVRPAGSRLCGSRALGIRRIEASILNFTQDFDWQHTPYDVGLGWMVSRTKGAYLAKVALEKLSEEERMPRLVGMRYEGHEVGRTADHVHCDGAFIGQVTSAVDSPTLGHGIGMAMLERRGVEPGTRLEVSRGDRRLAATVVPMPFLDPERRLAKA